MYFPVYQILLLNDIFDQFLFLSRIKLSTTYILYSSKVYQKFTNLSRYFKIQKFT